MSLPMPTLELIAELSVTVAAPIEAGDVQGASTRGKRRTIPITGGTVRGRLNGRVLAGGAAFQLIVSDTMAVLDAIHVGARFWRAHLRARPRAASRLGRCHR